MPRRPVIRARTPPMKAVGKRLILRFIAEVRTLDALNALGLDFPGITPVSA